MKEELGKVHIEDQIIDLVDEVESGEASSLSGLPRVCREYLLSLSQTFDVSVGYCLAAFLGLFSYLVPAVKVAAGDYWHEPLHLFVCLVGDGGSKKTAIVDHVIKELLPAKSDLLGSLDVRNAAMLLSTGRSMIYCGDDKDGMLANAPSTQRTRFEIFWGEVYDGRPIQRSDKERSSSILSPSCSTVLTTRPERFDARKNSTGPLLDRMLYFTNTIPRYEYPEKPDFSQSVKEVKDMATSIWKMKNHDERMPIPGVLQLDNAAMSTFENWRRMHREEASKASNPDTLAAAWGFAPGHVLRISGILHFLKLAQKQTSGDLVNQETVSSAIQIVEFCKNTRRYLNGRFDGCKEHKLLERLVRLSFKKKGQGIEPRDVTQQKWAENVEQAKRLLEALDGTYGEFRMIKAQSSRMVRRFFLFNSTLSTFST